MINIPSTSSGLPVRAATTSAVGNPSSASARSKPVLALARAVGELLDHVAHVVELDQSHDVAVEPEHAVHAVEVPVLEMFAERQRGQLRVRGRVGDLSRTRTSLARRRHAREHCLERGAGRAGRPGFRSAVGRGLGPRRP